MLVIFNALNEGLEGLSSKTWGLEEVIGASVAGTLGAKQ
jgi:hypothetical protein